MQHNYSLGLHLTEEDGPLNLPEKSGLAARLIHLSEAGVWLIHNSSFSQVFGVLSFPPPPQLSVWFLLILTGTRQVHPSEMSEKPQRRRFTPISRQSTGMMQRLTVSSCPTAAAPPRAHNHNRYPFLMCFASESTGVGTAALEQHQWHR